MIYDSSSISPSSGAGSPASSIIFLIFSIPFSLCLGGLVSFDPLQWRSRGEADAGRQVWAGKCGI
jgi:hypothetical protein